MHYHADPEKVILMDIVLPYPTASNASPRARKLKLAYRELCREKLSGLIPDKREKFMSVRFFPNVKGRSRGDIDNLLKTILDALKGFAFVDDGQVRGMFVLMMDIDKDNPRVELQISAYHPQKQKERISE